jgi:hypothetical protein
MKPILILLVLTLSSCATTFTPSASVFEVTGWDFREYANKGFLFTPHQYLGEYESMGIITINLIPGTLAIGQSAASYNGYSRKTLQGSPVGGGTTINYWEEDIDVEKCIDAIYQTAVDMGADAVMDFHVKDFQTFKGGVELTGFRGEGFAIKRK